MENVVILTVDCLRADRLGLTGCTRHITPYIDRLANESVVFQQAFSVGPRTTESFPSILASTYSLAFGSSFHFPSKYIRLAQALQKAGYSTAAFHSNPFLSANMGYSLGFDRFWDSMDQTPATSRLAAKVVPHINPESGLYKFLRRLIRGVEAQVGISYYTRAEVVTDMALKWLADQVSPFFLWIHYMDMHYPFNPPAVHLGKVRPGGVGKRRLADLMVRALEAPQSLNPEETQVIIDLYDGGLSYIDENVGRFLQALGDFNLEDDTLVILTGDHGEEFLEHGDFGHGALIHEPSQNGTRIKLYDELLHVPLLIRLGGSDVGPRQIHSLFSLVDLPPTIIELLGLQIPSEWQGISHSQLIRSGKGSFRSGVFSGYAVRDSEQRFPVVSYRTQEWKYIHDGVFGNHELYDLVKDPEERHNLYSAKPSILASMEDAVKQHLASIQSGQTGVSDLAIEPEMAERLKALGYLE